jgi:CxxC-x17-CxxC domain-containing protein
MADFKRGGSGGGFRGGRGGGRDRGSRFGGGRPSFGGGHRGGRDRDDKQMHKATCAECNKSCEVPFRPTGERPVYCSDCFGGSKGRPQRDSFSPRESFSTVEASGPKFDDRKIDEIKKQISEIEKKVERIINLLENNSGKSVEVMAAPIVKKAIEKKSKPATKKKAVSKKK